MKKHYKKTYRLRDRNCEDRSRHEKDWSYSLEHGGYHRAIRTFPEIRRNAGDKTDLRGEKIRYRNRSAADMLDAWNDYPISKGWGRSWKTYTKHRKQWMTGRDPAPKLPDWWTSWPLRARYYDLPWLGSFR